MSGALARDPDTFAHNGLPGPIPGTPERVPGAIRRTTNLDLTRPDGPDGPIRVTGRGRDLRTRPDGTPLVVASALVAAEIGGERVRDLSTYPRPAGIEALVGRRPVVGWRTGLWRYLRDDYDRGSVLHLVLDDLPGGMIIGGFTRGRELSQAASVSATFLTSGGTDGGREITGTRDSEPAQPGRRLDVCAGWAAESRAAQILARTGIPPAPVTPLAPDLIPAGDPVAWHTLPAVPVHGISRRRRIDVLDTGEEIVIEAWFRDSFTDAGGAHLVLHEYLVEVTADPATDAVRRLATHPRVLPHRECPVAAASVQAMRGVPLGRLRDRVSSDLFGPFSCTHLNDLLRGLADVPALLAPGPAA